MTFKLNPFDIEDAGIQGEESPRKDVGSRSLLQCRLSHTIFMTGVQLKCIHMQSRVLELVHETNDESCWYRVSNCITFDQMCIAL